VPEIVSCIIECYVFRRRADAAEFLILRRSAGSYMGDTWHPVQGRIEPRETAVQAALRELQEETALQPVRFWHLEFVDTYFQAGHDRILLCPCFCAEVAADAPVSLSPEHTEYRWVRAAEVEAALLWPGQRRAVREILELLIPATPAEAHLRVPLRA